MVPHEQMHVVGQMVGGVPAVELAKLGYLGQELDTNTGVYYCMYSLYDKRRVPFTSFII